MIRLALALAAAVTLGAALAAANDDPVVHVTTKRFEFEPRTITLKKGQRVVLELATLDRVHGFRVPDLGIAATAMPGEKTRIELVPQAAGRFPFLCDSFCGEGHEDMNGVIVVTD